METISIGLQRQSRVITALLIREIRLRNSKHAFSHLFDLLEALFYIVVHFIIFTFMGRHLIIGDSLLIFLTTGVAPVLYFRSISIRTAGAIASSTHLMTIPYIQPLDCAIARAGIEVISFILLFAAFLAGINIFGLSRFAIPYNFEPIIISLTCLTLTAFGFGLLNAYFIALFPLWKFLWSAISRCQIFYSGVFFIPEYMPPQLRRFLVYSPMMQFVSLFRTGFYPSYPTHLISISYIVWFTIAILFLGLGLERLWRGRALR